MTNFVDPPPVKRVPYHLVRMADNLRRHQGHWLLYREGLTEIAAKRQVTRINRGMLAFPEGFEGCRRRQDDGTYTVYIRYAGDEA